MKSLIVVLLLCLTLAFSTPILPKYLGGASIIDSKLSYMHNLRVSNESYNFWFAADKSHPNAFFFETDESLFLFQDESPLGANAQPFLAFDVVAHSKNEYLIGSTYGPNDKTALIGLPLQVAGDNGKVFNTYFPDFYFHAVTIDQTSLQNDGSVKFYLAGWKYNQDKTLAGFVIAQARTILGADNPRIIFNPQLDVLILEGICYDIFHELNRPEIYLNRDQIIVTVPGHCNAFYKTPVPQGNAALEGQTFQKFTIPGEERIVSSILNHANDRIYYALKNYNSAKITIKSFDSAQWKAAASTRELALNETVPVFAIDEVSGMLYVATAGFDRIYQWIDTNTEFTTERIATLPYRLSQISSMVYFRNYLYFVTDEPDAMIGRLSTTERFCSSFCGSNAYCLSLSAPVPLPGLCTCIEGYALPPDVYDTNQCEPEHQVEIIINKIDQQTGAFVFLALFLITLVIGIIGWVMWWRSRNSDTYADL